MVAEIFEMTQILISEVKERERKREEEKKEKENYRE